MPGVMLQGAPGRGGAIRMRGLGQGYTQILLDGQRVPAGFSIDSLVPEQIERIEILRAPTAETGARAIAGTINIVTREGFNKRLNDVHVGVASESGHAQGAASWTRNESVGPFVYNLSLSAFRRDRDSESVTTTTQQDVTTGATVLDQREHALRRDQGGGVHLNARLEWRPAEGETLMLTPMLVRSQGHGHREAQLEQSLPAGTAPYARAVTDSDSRFTLARMSAMWRRRLVDGTRLEWNGAASTSRYQSNNERNEYDALGARLRNVADASSSRDRSLTLNVKASKLLEGDHNLVTGAEFDSARRAEAGEGTDDTGGDLRATSTRTALYGQDEWQIDPHWAAHAGLRWEGIATRGQSIGEAMQTNRSAA